jgi:hypothetical protein
MLKSLHTIRAFPLTGYRGYFFSSLVYCAFALSVYFLQSYTPSLQVDHIAYWKSANEIIEQFPNGDYWRGITAVRTYGITPVKTYAVLLAYLYRVTSDHIVSLKLILLATTILYLFAFELFVSLFVRQKGLRVLFSVLSAFYVSFGHSFWGFTAFSASLNRSLVIPPVMVLLWFYFRYENRYRKYLVLPALVYLSLLHLSAYYVLAILVLYEFLYLLLFVRGTFSKRIVGLAAGVFLSGLAYVHLKSMGVSGVTVGSFLSQAGIHGIAGEPLEVLTSAQAWSIELFAQPWRNFPIPVATVLATLASQTFIWVLSGFGLWNKISGRLDEWDRRMLLLGFCVVVCATALQSSMWLLRHWFPVYPITFEEVRAITFLFLPVYYFVMQLILNLWDHVDISRKAVAVLVVFVFLLQPVYLMRMSPHSFRQWIYDFVVKHGVLEEWDSPRSVYAKQVLGLDVNGTRFYYDLQNVIRWLELHTDASDVVLTNRDELSLLHAAAVGNTVGFLRCETLFSMDRRAWQDEVLEYARALSLRDLEAVRRLAKRYHAKYAVVPWIIPAAEYSDHNYSVVSTAP